MNLSGDKSQLNQRSNFYNQQQFPQMQQQNNISFSNQQSSLLQNNDFSQPQYQNFNQGQNQEPPRIPKKRGRKPKPKPNDQNLSNNNSSSIPSPSMNTRTRSSMQNSNSRDNNNDGGDASEDENESEFDREEDSYEGIPTNAILCKTQFPFQPLVPNFSNSQNSNSNQSTNLSISSSRSSPFLSSSNSQSSGISHSLSVQNFDPNESQYLVNLPGQSPLHSFIVCEHSIKNGSQSGKLLNEFKKSCEYNRVKISSIGREFIEPCLMDKIVNVDSFEIDQIISHRTFESETKFLEKLMDDNLHIPGLPTDSFLPNFEEAFKYSSEFAPTSNESYLMLRDDGFFSFDENQGKGNQILKKELFHEVERDDEQKFEKSNNINLSLDETHENDPNDNNNDDDSTFIIPEKIEFKIQWKNLPVSESTWESYESLMNLINITGNLESEENRPNMNSSNNLFNKYLMNGSIIRHNLFCPTNMDEFEDIINVYWSRVVILGEKTIPLTTNSPKDELVIINEIPEEIPEMCRQTALTDLQQHLIRQLFEYKINFSNSLSYDYDSNGLVQIFPVKNTGRVFSVIGYLQMIYSIYHITKPSLIVVNGGFSQIWKDAFKTISNLFWIEFTGSSSDRMMLKHHRLDKKTRFDILITNCHVLEKEGDFLKTFQWENIIIDEIHTKKEFLFNSSMLSIESQDSMKPRKRRGRKPKNQNLTPIFGYNGNNEEYSSSKEDDNEDEDEDENENENEEENEKIKVDSSNSLDSALISHSHSLSLLSSNLLKNRSRYGNRSKKKNSSPFVILMNDSFPFSPIFNQMNFPDENGDFVPFHFQEIIFVVPNLLNKYIYKRLSVLFKKRAARVLNMGKAVNVLHELVLSLQHPLIIPEIHRELFNEYVTSRGLNPQRLPTGIEFEFLRSFCGKLKTLDELTIGNQEKALSISIVVAEDLAILKLLWLYFVMRRIPAGIVNSNVASERVPDDFAYGILLMNRDTTHPMIDKFTISQIIFYDVSTSYKKDLDFVQFVTRNQNLRNIEQQQQQDEDEFTQVDVCRLLTNHSLEIELFIKTTMNNSEDGQEFAYFDYKDLSMRNAEQLIRAAVIAAKEAEIERGEDDELSNQSQFQLQNPFQHQQHQRNASNQQEIVTSFSFEFPNQNSELPSRLNSVMDQTERDEFWAFAFQSAQPTKTEITDFSNYKYDFDENEESQAQPEQQNETQNLPEYRLYIELLKHGLNNWEIISQSIDKPFEEVKKIGQTMVLKMLSSINVNDIFRFTLASNIYWFEYNGSFATGHQLDEPEFWIRIAESKSKQINSPLFNNPCFSVSNGGNQTVFNGLSAERNLLYFEKNYIVRCFLLVRQQPYIPTRLLAKKESVMYSAPFIYAFLNFYANNTGDWEAIKVKFHFEMYSTEAIIGYFDELYNAILADLYSFILHRAYSGERQELIDNYELIWPLLQVFEQGPFTLNWTEPEIQRITNVLLSFSVPLAGQSIEDWCEFHSLAQLLTKSTESIEFMTSYIVEGITESQENQKFVIIPDLTQSDPITIPPNVVKKLKMRVSTLTYIQQISRMEKVEVFRPQVNLPDKWTLDNDISIINGICQFGYGHIFDLGKVNVEAYSEADNGRYCAVMLTDLSEFDSFVSDKSSLLLRLKLIVTANAQIGQNKVNLVNEQLSDATNKVTTLHRRGRPPNPNKHKEQIVSKSSSTVSKPSRQTETLSNEPKAASASSLDVAEIEKNSETTQKVRKGQISSQKKKRLEDESGFTPELEAQEDDDDDEDVEYGENDEDSDENSGFITRLRASRPMATRARSSLESDKGGVMQTRSKEKKKEKRGQKQEKREIKKEDDDGDEIEIKDEVEISPKPKIKTIKNKPKNSPQKVRQPKPDSDGEFIENEDEEIDSSEININQTKSLKNSKPIQTRNQVKNPAQNVRSSRNRRFRRFDENGEEEEEEVNEDEDEFQYSDDDGIIEDNEDELGQNDNSSVAMRTRSHSVQKKKTGDFLIKTRSQTSKQKTKSVVDNKAKEKEKQGDAKQQTKKKEMKKRFRQISFTLDPLPERIKFVPE